MASNLELNKIFAAFLIFSIIVLGGSMMVDYFYMGDEKTSAKKGYAIEISDEERVIESNAESDIDPFEGIDFLALLKDANVEKGKKVFKKCFSCHTAEKDGQNRVGPALWNVLDRQIASKEDYNYSQVFQKHGGNWTEEQLFRYLHKPSKYMPGTRMVFAGVKKTDDLADLILYLASLNDNPKNYK